MDVKPYPENDGLEDVGLMCFQLAKVTNDRLSEIGELYSAYDYENIMFNSFYLNYAERKVSKIQMDKMRSDKN